MEKGFHVPVLLKEVLEYLNPQEGNTVIDATFGFGGHSEKILKRIGKKGLLIAVEKDREVLEKARSRFKAENIIFVNEDFRNLGSILEKNKIKKADRILFDLGISSYHFDLSGRGFSFSKDEPLDMRIDKSKGATAADLVSGLTKRELADLFFQLADERHSRRIADEIVKSRRNRKITATGELVAIIEKVKPRRKIHPATQVFQALRIAVNDELGALRDALESATYLKINGRMAVISFHSGEDRIVKKYFKNRAKSGQYQILTKKPIVASREEINANPRSRSAKLRAIMRVK
ncbi:MAG: 16S rRNA (cytosine(1402)-N(4))-methyltransferase RsmH [Candidatus Berkelbacteria bacterium]|nr:16S rRNA (cytosine(1402)-N(4))-methyltransferase RsmH [Candidatus Berkelbacteria bacterium]